MKLQFVGVTDRPNNRARATVNLSGGGSAVNLEIRGGGQKIEFHDEMRVAMSIIYFNHFQRFLTISLAKNRRTPTNNR